MIRIFIYSLFLIFIFSHTAKTEPLDQKISHYKMKNGMEIYVIPVKRSPIILHSLWYRVGSVNDPVGYSGIAHYLEHLMFKGSSKFHPFFEEIEKIGGIANAFTTHFLTMYYSIFAKENLERIIAIEADRMNNIKISSDEALKERNVVLEERNMRIDSQPVNLLYEEVMRVFSNQFHNRPVIGWKNEINNLDAKVAGKFYAKYYNPNNAVLIVAGDVDSEEVIKLAKKNYTYKKGNRLDNYSYTDDNSIKFPTTITYAGNSLVSEPLLYFAYKFPRKLSDVEQLSAQLLASILGGKNHSLLNENLIKKSNLVVAINANYDSTLNALEISTTPNHNSELDSIESSIEKIINNLIDKGVTVEELEERKRSYKESIHIDNASDILSMVIFYGNHIIKGASLQDIKNLYGDKLNNITTDDINKLMNSLFSSKVKLTAKLLPPKNEVNK